MPDKDPSQMTDEELDAIVGVDPETVEEDDDPEKGKEDPKDDAPADEDEDEDEEDDDPEDDPGDDKLIEDKDDKGPSRREQLRIRDILAKRQQPQAAATEKAAERLDYAKELNADPELIQQLEADRDAAVRQAADLSTSTAESIRWDTMLRIDAQRVFQEHKILDKTSEEFNPNVSDALNEFYLQMSGFDPKTKLVTNPGIGYADFTEAMFELANEIANNSTATSEQNRKSQRSKTGIRPGGGTAKKLNLNQAPENMSDEELDAFLEQNIPTRR